MDGYIGQITMFAGDFAPRGWALCNGQLLSVAQYTSLFAIIGNMYGGDGRSSFALPDLRGRAPAARRRRSWANASASWATWRLRVCDPHSKRDAVAWASSWSGSGQQFGWHL